MTTGFQSLANIFNTYPFEFISDVNNFEQSAVLHHHYPVTPIGLKIIRLTIPNFNYTESQLGIVGQSIISKMCDYSEEPSNKQTSFVAVTLKESANVADSHKVFEDAITDFSSARKVLCAIVSFDGENWFTLYFLKVHQEIQLIHFDPLGKPMSPSLKFLMKKNINISEVFTHQGDANEYNDFQTCDTGPICLRYFERLRTGCEGTPDFFLHWRSKSQFEVLLELNLLPHQRPKEITRLKYHFQYISYQQTVLSELACRAQAASSHELQDFNQQLNKYLEKFLRLQEVEHLYLNYNKSLRASLQYKGNSQDEKVTQELEGARNQIENHSFLKEMIQEGENAFRGFTATQLEPVTFEDDDFIEIKSNYYVLCRLVSEAFRVITDLSGSINPHSLKKFKGEMCHTFGFEDKFAKRLFQPTETKGRQNLDDQEIQDLNQFLCSPRSSSTQEEVCRINKASQDVKITSHQERLKAMEIDEVQMSDEELQALKKIIESFEFPPSKQYHQYSWNDVTNNSFQEIGIETTESFPPTLPTTLEEEPRINRNSLQAFHYCSNKLKTLPEGLRTKFRFPLLEKLHRVFLEDNKKLDNDPHIDQLIEAYEIFLECSSSCTWRQASLMEIKNGVISLKNAPISEIIVILDRANELLTKGRRLTLPQVLTLLQFGNANKTQGTICKIHPGSDRSKIICLLATAKILSGERFVDIITLSQELAEVAVRENKEFFELFGIQVATNNFHWKENNAGISEESHLRKSYRADVVYGTLNNFKKDYLMDICGPRRANREFGMLILDEMGDELVEDAGSLSALTIRADQGTDILHEVYNQIWSCLNTLDELSCADIIGKQLIEEKSSLLRTGEITSLEAQQQYEELCSAMEMTIYDWFHTRIKHQVITNCQDIVPDHFMGLNYSCIDEWIHSALIAKYKLKEYFDYYLHRSQSGVKVLPLDEEHNSPRRIMWTREIHHFLQLKHNLEVTKGRITISSISNVGYIKLYGPNLLALTSTLGSVVEQILLKEMYNVTFLIIPTFQSKRFLEFEGRIINDMNWDKYVAVEAKMRAVQDGRAVLIFCESIDDCLKVEHCLKALETIPMQTHEILFQQYSGKFRTIRVLTEEIEAAVSPGVLYPGDVFVTTKEVGRTLNVSSSKELDLNGGLHICLGFCPRNEREKERFFRNAQRGVVGTAQILVRKSDLQSMAPEAEIIEKPLKIPEQPKINEVQLNLEDCRQAESSSGIGNGESSQSSSSLIEQNSDSSNSNEIPSLDQSDKYEYLACRMKDEWYAPHKRNITQDAVPSTSGAQTPREYSKLDQHVLYLLMTGLSRSTFKEVFNLDINTATVGEVIDCLWDTMVAYMTESAKVNVMKFIELRHNSCYRNHLANFEQEVRKTKAQVEEFQREITQDFSIRHWVGGVISTFWTEFSHDYPSEDDEIRAVIRKRNKLLQRRLHRDIPKFYSEDKLYKYFTNFRWGLAQQKCYSSSSHCYFEASQLDHLWGIWLHMKDRDQIIQSLDETYWGLNHIQGNFPNEKDCDKVGEEIFHAFQHFLTENNEKLELINGNVKTCKTDCLPGSKSAPDDLEQSAKVSCVQTTHGNRICLTSLRPTTADLTSILNNQKTKLEDLIQKIMLTEVELLGLDILQYLRTNTEPIETANPVGEITAGVATLSKSQSTVVPPALSHAASTAVTLIIEGTLKFAIYLLGENNLEDQNPPFQLQLITFVINLISTGNFIINLQNAELMAEAAKELARLEIQLRKCTTDFDIFIQRLRIQLKRFLSAIRQCMIMYYSQSGEVRDLEDFPSILSSQESLVQDCRRIIGSRVMSHILINDTIISVIKTSKPVVHFHIRKATHNVPEFWSDFKFIPELTFRQNCGDSFDENCQAFCSLICDDTIKEIFDNSQNFQGVPVCNCLSESTPCTWSKISELSKIFIENLEISLSSCSKSQEIRSGPEISVEYPMDFLGQKVLDTLEYFAKRFIGESKPKSNDSEHQPYDLKKFHRNMYRTKNQIQEKICDKLTNKDSLLKYHLAYMMDTAKLNRDLDYLDYLKVGCSPSSVEDLRILANYLGYSFKLQGSRAEETIIGSEVFGSLSIQLMKKNGCPRGHYRFASEPTHLVTSEKDSASKNEFLNFLLHNTKKSGGKDLKSTEELRNHLIRFRENRIECEIDKHKVMQVEMAEALGGTYRFDEALNDSGGWSVFGMVDAACEFLFQNSENKAGDFQELNGILKARDELQFGHSISKHSSPENGLKYVKEHRKSKCLSTFESFHHQMKAFQACMKKMRFRPKLLAFVRGIDYEVHVDASLLDLPSALRLYEIRRGPTGKPFIEETPSVVRFITLILGYRFEHSKSDSRRKRQFHHVHTIIPRSERPDELLAGEPCLIKIRSRANEGHVIGGTNKWYEINNRFFAWKS